MRLSFLVLLLLALPAIAQEKDRRLGKPIDYNGYFPWTPPTSRESWDHRRKIVKEQVLVGTGLWPMPEKTPLREVIHGKMEREGYTIEKVYFQSFPGHFVTGNLYRPTGKTGKVPGVLCPHGHWANGRFFEASDKIAEAQVKQGAEKTIESAKYPLQARCAQLARMGCIVFHYDMEGYADSQQMKHREGFNDIEADLRAQNYMLLQTWNSIRALDFLLGLPDVDAKRIGVTGASGGGTQTFMLCAVDDRPTVAFPAVMVSTAMQGGCVCENCSYLRVGTGNIELAGLFAPKPLGMVGADDWTINIETRGLPELKALYKLYGVPDLVMAKTYKQFKHNYNQVSRELMYNWFNRHLNLGHKEPIEEKPFVPVPPKELSVWTGEHKAPEPDLPSLRNYLTKQAEQQLLSLFPKDEKSLAEFRRVLGAALRSMMVDELPAAKEVEEVGTSAKEQKNGLSITRTVLSRKDQGERVPVEIVKPADFNGTVVVWVHPEGLPGLWEKGEIQFQAKQVLDRKAGILAVETFRTGSSAQEPLPKMPSFPGYFFGYNRSTLGNRVHDILTAIAYARSLPGTKTVHLVGMERAGPWVVLARGLAGESVQRTAADLNNFRFEEILSAQDEMMQPAALRYGGLPVLAALVAPHDLLVHNTQGIGTTAWLESAYKISGKSNQLENQARMLAFDKVAAWLLR